MLITKLVMTKAQFGSLLNIQLFLKLAMNKAQTINDSFKGSQTCICSVHTETLADQQRSLVRQSC